jgi:hypothetical protein
MRLGDRVRFVHSVIGFLAISLQGCGAIGYDHREKIASAVLFKSNGDLDERVFVAALTERFSSDLFPQASLQSFVEELGGKCTGNMIDSMSCTIPRASRFCIDSRIRIEATMLAGSFKISKVASDHRAC